MACHIFLSGLLLVAIDARPLAAQAAGAKYSIFLKNQSDPVIARQKPELRDGYYHFQDRAGNFQKIKASEVDEAKTQKVNEEGLGGTYALPGQGVSLQSLPQPKPTGSNLGIIARQRRGEMKDPSAVFNPAAPTPEALERFAQASKGAEPSPKSAVPSPLNDAFMRALETAGIRNATLAPLPNGIKIQAHTDTEQQVFSAIGASARALKEVRTQGQSIDRVELTLNTTGGEAAGRFVLTVDDAENLLTGKISAAKYFLASVQF
jgi:hypothetical protein